MDDPSVTAIAGETRDPFRVLISTIISLRTKDAVTISASRRLFSRAPDPATMVELPEEELAELIYPAGFYRVKAGQIHRICRILLEDYAGLVPQGQSDLMGLPGVGLKTANLTLSEGFGIDAICVDIHVHRIANRAGWIKAPTPDASEAALRDVLPRRYWRGINKLLVTFGQRVCKPRGPQCHRCPIYEDCRRVGVTPPHSP